MLKINELLAREEGKTLEFKRDCSSLDPIVKTVIAFANTAGGQILIGIRDQSKEIVGVEDPTGDESRLCNAFSDMICPQMIPDINIINYRGLSLLLISVPHLSGPYYLRAIGLERGAYIRLGSSNRVADVDMLEELKRQAQNRCYDETPLPGLNSEQIDFRVASELFAKHGKLIDMNKLANMGTLQLHGERMVPSIGGLLLFGLNKATEFPDAKIKCARFKGNTSAEFVDNLETSSGLIDAVDETIAFIRRHTKQGLEIGTTAHKVILEYPDIAIRETVINAIVHTDYAIKGMSIRIGIFDDRIEITNPGSLPFGISMEHIFSGVSKLRNRVIGRVFHELGLIEQWGTGISRIKETCNLANIPEPHFEELGGSFRVTLYSGSKPHIAKRGWELQLVEHLQKHQEVSSKQAADLWGISERAARTKLKILIEDRVITKIATNPNDPKTVYVLQSWN